LDLFRPVTHNGYANTIRKKLNQLSGVKVVEVDVATQTLTIIHKALIRKAVFLNNLASWITQNWVL